MGIHRIRILITALLATAAVGVTAGPVATSHAEVVKSYPTGSSGLDDICSQMAGLINHAYSEGDLALVNGQNEDADAWYDLAADMIRRATNAGCRLTEYRKAPMDSISPHGDGLLTAPESTTSSAPTGTGDAGAPTTGTTETPDASTPKEPTADTPDSGTPAPRTPATYLVVGRPRVDAAKGTVVLRIAVSGPGRVRALATARLGKGRTARTTIARSERTVGKAGLLKLTLKPRGKAWRVLRKAGRLPAKVNVAFKPTGQLTATRHLPVAFKLKPRR